MKLCITAAKAIAVVALSPVLPLAFAHEHGGYAYDTAQKTSNEYWMTYMNDSVRLSEMSIPGTHDTMAYGSTFGDPIIQAFNPLQGVAQFLIDEITRTQTMNLETQLKSGIRMLDIRCQRVNNNSMFEIYHGIVRLGFSFDYVLNTVISFLKSHPGETVLMYVAENGAKDAPAFENIFRSYYNSLQYQDYFWKPSSQSDSNPTLGSMRGKIVVLQNFTGAPYGIGWLKNFIIQNNWKLDTNWDLYWKWEQVKDHLKKAMTGNMNDKYVNFLSGSTGSLPYFVASGHSSPGTSAPRLSTGKVTPFFNDWPDFPRVDCFLFMCTIVFEGTNVLTTDMLPVDDASHTRVGIIVADFPGPELINRVISQNTRNNVDITFTRGQLRLPDGQTASCIDRPKTNYTLASNGWQKLIWQTDGNLVIYDAKGARWSTGTYTLPVTTLCWQSDGNLVIYRLGGVAFATGTHGKGETLTLDKGCNLVIRNSAGSPLWSPQGDWKPSPCTKK